MKENFVDYDEKEKEQEPPKIKVIGIGQTGQLLTDYFAEQIENVEVFSLQCDKKLLENSKLDNEHKFLIGEEITEGLGTGGNPKIGERIALSSENIIREVIKDADLVIVAAGYSGGLGSGATPVLTKIAKEMGALSMVFAVMPAEIEGQRRNLIANERLQKLVDDNNTDSILNVSRERFFEDMELDQSSFIDGFDMVNKEVVTGIKNIISLFREDGINKNFFENNGFIGMGFCGKKTDVNEAIMDTFDYPMLRGATKYAKKFLLDIKCGDNMLLKTILEIQRIVLAQTDISTKYVTIYQMDRSLSPDEFQIIYIAT